MHSQKNGWEGVTGRWKITFKGVMWYASFKEEKDAVCFSLTF